MPITTYQTPPVLVRRRLLDYDRHHHLMPLVYTYSKQDIATGRGELVGFLYYILYFFLNEPFLTGGL